MITNEKISTEALKQVNAITNKNVPWIILTHCLSEFTYFLKILLILVSKVYKMLLIYEIGN